MQIATQTVRPKVIQSHTPAGEVCVEGKQRALPLFSLAKNVNVTDSAITFRNCIVKEMHVRTRKDTDKHLHGRW